jgi:hypothetical protein
MKNTLTREEVVAVAGKPAPPPLAPLLPLLEMFLLKSEMFLPKSEMFLPKSEMFLPKSEMFLVTTQLVKRHKEPVVNYCSKNINKQTIGKL